MGKRIYITEQQFKAIINEMAYPVSFNFEEFGSLKLLIFFDKCAKLFTNFPIQEILSIL